MTSIQDTVSSHLTHSPYFIIWHVSYIFLDVLNNPYPVPLLCGVYEYSCLQKVYGITTHPSFVIVMILVTEFLSLHLILLSYSYLVHFIYSMNTKALEYMDFTVHLCTLQSGVYRFSTRVFSPILYSSVALIFIYCKHKSTVGKLITSQTPQCTKSLIDQTEKCFK